MTSPAPTTVVDRLAELRLSAEAAQRLGTARVLHLSRSWPRDATHLLVEYSDGRTAVAGQWLRDRAELLARAESTRATGSGGVAVAPDAGVLLQRGVDRRLPGLRRVLSRPRAELVAHRPERRAVVRLDGDCYAKLVRPGRVAALIGAADAVRGLGFATPRLLDADPDHGLTVWSALGGRSWYDRLAVHEPDEDAAVAVGAALRRLHDAAPVAGLPAHTPADEAAVVTRWAGHRRALVDDADAAAPLRKVRALLAGPRAPPVVVHRDFYDKQAFVGDGGVGVLDFDTLALGEAALDVGNALAHVELRVLQGRLDRSAGAGVAAAFLDGYRPGPQVTRRLPAYLAASRMRLWSVYAFRPRWRAAVAPFARQADPLQYPRRPGDASLVVPRRRATFEG